MGLKYFFFFTAECRVLTNPRYFYCVKRDMLLNERREKKMITIVVVAFVQCYYY